MAQFDPYRTWLGIAPEEQPPNLYRLLGIGLFESDPDVISNAADRQMAHVRTYQTGEHSDLSQNLLHELAAAQLVLLDGPRRGAYDKKLRDEGMAARPVAVQPAVQAMMPTPVPASPVPVTAAAAVPIVVDGTDSDAPQFSPSYTTSSRSNGYSRRRKKQSPAVPVILGVGTVVLIVIIALVALNASKTPTPPRRTPAAYQPPAYTDNDTGNRGPSPPERPPKRPKKPKKKRPRKPAGDAKSDGAEKTPTAAEPGEIRSMKGHTDTATSVVVSPSGLIGVSGGFDKSVRFWDLQDGEDLRTIGGSKVPIIALDFSSNGKKVLASMGKTQPASGGTLCIWDANTGRVAERLSLDDLGGAKVAWDAKFSPNSELVVLGCGDGNVRLIDVADESLLFTLKGHEGAVRSVAFSRDGNVLASGGADGTVRLWNRYTGQPLHTMTGHKGPVTGVDFSPSGDHVVSGGDDAIVRYWAKATGKQIRSCKGHAGAVNSVAHSPSGALAISGGKDGTVRLWNLTTGQQVASFDKHKGPVCSVAFSGRPDRAVSTGDDRMVRLWQLPKVEASATEVAGAPIGLPESGLKPLPEAAAQKAAVDRIKNDEFKLDFAGADRPSRRLALAEKLLAEGAKPQDDSARQYALLRLAWNDATECANPELALRAVDTMGQSFEIDVVGAKAVTLNSLANKMIGSPPARKQELTKRILTVVDEAVAANDSDAAQRLVATAKRVVAGARDPDLAETVAQKARQIGAPPAETPGAGTPANVEKQPEVAGMGIDEALEVLKTDPADPEANLAAGKHYCFEKDDWGRGLLKLAASADRKLRPLARAELDDPQEPEKRLELADRWWDAAESQHGDAKRRIREHAVMHYQLVLPQLEETQQFRVQLRIQEVVPE